MGAITPFFRAQMKRLIGLKFAPSDLTTHWEALRDVPDEQLEMAVTAAQVSCDEFPSPKTLLALIRRDVYGHVPPCRNYAECIARVLGRQQEREAS